MKLERKTRRWICPDWARSGGGKEELARFRFLVSDPLHAHFAQCGSRDLSADHPIPSSLIQSNPVPYSSIQNKRPFTVGVFLGQAFAHQPPAWHMIPTFTPGAIPRRNGF